MIHLLIVIVETWVLLLLVEVLRVSAVNSVSSEVLLSWKVLVVSILLRLPRIVNMWIIFTGTHWSTSFGSHTLDAAADKVLAG